MAPSLQSPGEGVLTWLIPSADLEAEAQRWGGAWLEVTSSFIPKPWLILLS